MDESTLFRLLDAAASFEIARHLDTEWFSGVLKSIHEHPASSSERKAVVRRLEARIKGWQALEDALTDTQTDFNAAVDMIKDIGNEENSWGIWLESMITHHNLLTKLGEHPVVPNAPPFERISSTVSHNDFLAFVRAYIGVSSVLAVYAWSDSLPNPRCRERTLGILRLWQSVEGYREVNSTVLWLYTIAKRTRLSTICCYCDR